MDYIIDFGTEPVFSIEVSSGDEDHFENTHQEENDNVPVTNELNDLGVVYTITELPEKYPQNLNGVQRTQEGKRDYTSVKTQPFMECIEIISDDEVVNKKITIKKTNKIKEPNASSSLPTLIYPKFPCNVEECNKVFGKLADLEAHMRCHTGERPYICNWAHCCKRFKRSDELQRHRRTHTGEKRFQCDECSKKFRRRDHLKSHIQTHLRKRYGETLANLHSNYNDVNRLNKLNHVAISPQVKTFQTEPQLTPQSQYIQQQLDDQKWTIVDGHSNVSTVLTPALSSQYSTFRSSQQLVNVDVTNEQTNHKIRYRCDILGCEKVYGKRSHLQAHLLWHTGDRPFVCSWEFCGKSFTRADHLKRHWRIHNTEKRFQCGECGRRFMRRDHLVVHKRTHTKKRYEAQIKMALTMNESNHGEWDSNTNLRNFTITETDSPRQDHECELQIKQPATLTFSNNATPLYDLYQETSLPQSPPSPAVLPLVPLLQQVKQALNCSVDNNYYTAPAVTDLTSVIALSPTSENLTVELHPNFVNGDTEAYDYDNQKPKKLINSKKHVCYIAECTKVFQKPSHLQAHIRWHKGERPFACNWEDCDKRFSRSDELQRHRRTHTGEKRFECCECNKRFTRSDHLSKHKKTHTRQRNMITKHMEINKDKIKYVGWETTNTNYTASRNLNTSAVVYSNATQEQGLKIELPLVSSLSNNVRELHESDQETLLPQSQICLVASPIMPKLQHIKQEPLDQLLIVDNGHCKAATLTDLTSAIALSPTSSNLPAELDPKLENEDINANDSDNQKPVIATNRKMHPCTECTKVFHNPSHLAAHVRCHRQERRFVCNWEHCDKRFKRSDELQRHRRTHTGEKQFECCECNKTFTRSDYLSNHKKTHTRQRNMMIPVLYNNVRELHASDQEALLAQSQTCPAAPPIMPNGKPICLQHIKQEPLAPDQLLSFDNDHYKAAAHTDLISVIALSPTSSNLSAEIHPKLENDDTKANDSDNQNPTKPINRKIHACMECTKVFHKPSHLTAHIRCHSGERPFVCNWENCDKRFTRSDELQRHKRTHTGEKRFECCECNKRFTRSDHLSKHKKTHIRQRHMYQQLFKINELGEKLAQKTENQSLEKSTLDIIEDLDTEIVVTKSEKLDKNCNNHL